MNKGKQTEQQLLEEQLDAVTGGCGACVNDKMLAAEKLRQSMGAQLDSSKAILPSSRRRYLNNANALQSEAESLLARVVQRHQDPNHQNIH